MNPFFSIKRFADYSRKQYSEQRKVYLFGAILIVLAVAAIFWACCQQLNGEMILIRRPEMVLTYTLLLWGVSIFAFFLLWNSRDLVNPSKNLLYMLTPASSFEKYFFVWLNSVSLSLFVLLVFGGMYRLFGLFVHYGKPLYFSEILSSMAFPLLLVHALSLFLLVVFRRHGLLAGIVIITVFILLFGLIPHWLMRWGVIENGYSARLDPFYTDFPIRTGDFWYDVSWIGGVSACVSTRCYA